MSKNVQICNNCNAGSKFLDEACCVVLTKLRAKMKDRTVISQRKIPNRKIPHQSRIGLRHLRGTYLFC